VEGYLAWGCAVYAVGAGQLAREGCDLLERNHSVSPSVQLDPPLLDS